MQDAEPKRISTGALIAIAAAYAACYELTQHVSFSHWNLSSGLRLSALLLVPRRYWPALLLGETLPVIEHAVLFAPRFGMNWAMITGIPVIALCMPVVALVRRKLALHRPDGSLNIGLILATTLVCAVLNASLNDLALRAALAAAPGAWPELDASTYFFAYLLGSYLGALTLTPSFLALKMAVDAPASQKWLQGSLRAPTVALVVAAASLMLAVGLLAGHAQGGMLMALRLGVALPVLALTLRFGWQGGALAGLVASVVLATTSTTLLDPPMINAQIVLAFVLSGALLIGIPIARVKMARLGMARLGQARAFGNPGRGTAVSD